MKIVLAQGETKRVIHGQFSACLSAQDALRIAELLTAHAADTPYGWVVLYDKPEIDGPADSKPLPF